MNQLDDMYSDDAKIFAQKYFSYLSSMLLKLDTNQISNFIDILELARERGSAIFFIGNGGSAATASHFANDLLSLNSNLARTFKVFSLVDNVPLITCIANDYGYDQIFSRQLSSLAKPNDVLVSISASGNSENLIKAINVAKKNKLVTVGITGFDGGWLKENCDFSVHIPTNLKEYGPAEDCHIVLDHLIHSYLSRKLLNYEK